MTKLKIKVTSIQAKAIMTIENDCINQLQGWKTSGLEAFYNQDLKIMSRMILIETISILDKFERIAKSNSTRSLTLTYTEAVSFYYTLKFFPINEVDVLLQIVINEFLEILHRFLFC
jgi:hypothetical protein